MARDDALPELDDYDFELPDDAIAQHPPEARDGARLLVLARAGAPPTHHRVTDLPALLAPGDLLVVNTTRVLAARLRGRKTSGARVEALLLEEESERKFRCLVRSSGKLKPGLKFRFGAEAGSGGLDAELVALGEDGAVLLEFAPGPSPYALGEAPLPPYIRRPAPRAADLERYQTVFAREPGAVAAPTAGLHLSRELLAALEARGIARAEVVLHVGAGTFRPLDRRALDTGDLHAERFALPEATALAVERTRREGGRVVAVGTTSCRVLESCATEDGRVEARSGVTRLFLRPGTPFRAVDALFTNFHLPRSSLLMLVAAFAGRERVLDAYREALARGYRFYSYGDAMLVL